MMLVNPYFSKALYYFLVTIFGLIAGFSFGQNDIMLTSPKYTNYIPGEPENWRDLEYSVYPISQLRPLEMNAVAYNIGSQEQTGVYLAVHITSDNGYDEVLTSSSVNLAQWESATLIIDPYTPPAQVGEYNLEFTMHQDAEDNNPANNIATRTFSISEAEFARDMGALTSVAELGIEGTEFSAGPGFHFTEDAEVHCIGAVLSSQSSLGTDFNYALMTFDGNWLEYVNESELGLTTEDNLSGFGESNFIWLPMLVFGGQPNFVEAEGELLPMFQHFGLNEVIVGTSGVAPISTNYVVAEFDVQSCTPCYSNNTYMVRMGLSEEFCESVITVFPEIEWLDVSGSVFYDENCDGTFNDNDQALPSTMIMDDEEEPVAMTNQQGEYSLELSAGEEHFLSVVDMPGFSVNSNTVNEENTAVVSNVNFGYCFQNPSTDVGVTITLDGHAPRPGFPVGYQICVTNYGSVEAAGGVSFDFSEMPGVTITETDGGVLMGDALQWSIEGLGVFQSECFHVSMTVSEETPAGTMYSPVANIQVDSEEDINPSNNTHVFAHEVVETVIDFDKTVDKPLVNYTELEPGQVVSLEYVIRFQNTGGSTVTNVRVEDELPELLDITTLEIIDVSHEYDILIHPDNHIEWIFEDIMLPDSTANEPESHGKIHFRVNTIEGINLNDIIENQAMIYFDESPAVETEYAETAFIDCAEGSLEINSSHPACVGETMGFHPLHSSYVPLYQSFIWEINGEEFDEFVLIYPITETTIDVTLSISSAVCNLTVTETIEAAEVPELEIVLDFDVLYSSQEAAEYEWYFDDFILDGETGSSITPQANGLYQLFVTFETGCYTNADLLVETVGVNELDKTKVQLIPNPANGFTSLVSSTLIKNIEILSLSGQTLNRFENISGNRFDIDLSLLSPGLYFLRIESNGDRMVKKLVVE